MKVNIDLTKTISANEIIDELKTDVGASSFSLYHDFFYGSTDVEIWTAAAGTGTQLIDTTDYTLGDLNSDLTTRAGINIYGSITVINATYQTGDLYFTYHACADHVDAIDIVNIENLDGEVTFQDSYVTSAIPLSESGTTGLSGFTATSIVGALNEAVTLGGSEAVEEAKLGESWIAVAAPEDNSWQGIAYGNGVFIAVAYSGTNRIMRSTDLGLTWTAVAAIEDNSWRSIAYGNNIFVAVAFDGTNRTMWSDDDGLTWIAVAAGEDNNWASIAYGNGIFIAVSADGTNRTMWSDDDGLTWTAVAAAEDSGWNSIAYGNGVFVAVASSGTNRTMWSDDDGASWTAVAATEASQWRSVAYGNGVFISVSNDATEQVMRSTDDGLTWTAYSSAEDNGWLNVTYGNGIFVAVAFSGTNRVMISTDDGLTWTAVAAAEDNNWRSTIYGNEVFVAVSSDGTNQIMKSTALINIASSGQLSFKDSHVTNPITLSEHGTTGFAGFSATSIIGAINETRSILPDGATWTYGFDDANNWYAIGYGNDVLMVGGYSNRHLLRSDDNGATWTELTNEAPATAIWLDFAYGNGTWVATGDYDESIPANDAYSLDEGLTWTITPINNSDWNAVNYANGIFIKVASYNVGSDQRISRSTDGISWTGVTSAITDLQQFFGIAYNPDDEAWVTVGTGATNRIARSTDDGANWTAITSPEANWWRSIAYGNEVFVAVSSDGSDRSMRSTDGGLTFSVVDIGAYSWMNIIYADGVFIAIAGATIGRSDDDGLTWTIHTKTGTSGRSITYTGSTLVAVGFGNAFAFSDNVSLVNTNKIQSDSHLKIESVDDLIVSSSDGITYLTNNVVIPDGAPTSPVDGSLYWDGTALRLYIYRGDTSGWAYASFTLV